jgi:hypothetical protein
LHDVGNHPPTHELVECYSGSRYGERPQALYWLGERLEIEKIEIRERRPQGWYFRVLTRSGQIFDLLFDESKDSWEINYVG